MSWFVAVMLIGQVRSSGDFAGERPPTQVTNSRPASVGLGDSDASTSPSVTREGVPPVRPTLSSGTSDKRFASEPAERSTKWRTGQQAGAAETASAKTTEALQAAAIRLEELLAFDEANENESRRLRLVEALARNGDPQTQAITIADYWGLTSAVGHARFANGKVRLLAEVPAPNDEADRAMLDAAVTAAAAEEAAAQDEMLAAQYRLLQTAHVPWDGKLPWPVDLPLIGAYRTHFDSLFAQRTAPLSLRFLHQSLPGKLRLIEKRVTAMAAAESAVDATLESYRRGGSSLTLLLQTVERLDDARRTFLSSVIDYNGRIAEYSLAAVGSPLEPETLVSTLIKVTPANTAIAIIPRQTNPRGTTPREMTPQEKFSSENIPSDVHPASAEATTFQPEQRTLRR